MNTFLYFGLVIGYIVLFVWALLLSKNHSLLDATNTLILVIIGLIYDNFIITLGQFLGEGSVLKSLSYSRYLFHAFFTPTLIVFAWSISYRTGFSWAQKSFWKMLIILLTCGLILYELFTSLWGLELNPKWEHGILTYDSTNQSALMVLIVTVVLSIVSILFIKKHRFFWPFIGILFMILCVVLARWVPDLPLTNIGEFILIVSLLMTKRFYIKNKTPVQN